MVSEVLEHLAPSRGGVFVDCTVGLGGHARALLEAGATRLIGIDRDPDALARAGEALTAFGDRVSLVHGDYREPRRACSRRAAIDAVDGVLADLGVSSMQLDAPDRGFSFRRDEPLDMRMDTSSGATAADMLAAADERTLADVIYEFGEERHARRVARAIVEARPDTPHRDDGPAGGRRPAGGPAQGLLADRSGDADVPGDPHLGESRARGARRVPDARGRPARAGRAAGGDHVPLARGPRREAHAAGAADGGTASRIRTKRPQVPSEAEIERNPRARSAKLRAATRSEQAVRT